ELPLSEGGERGGDRERQNERADPAGAARDAHELRERRPGWARVGVAAGLVGHPTTLPSEAGGPSPAAGRVRGSRGDAQTSRAARRTRSADASSGSRWLARSAS